MKTTVSMPLWGLLLLLSIAFLDGVYGFWLLHVLAEFIKHYSGAKP